MSTWPPAASATRRRGEGQTYQISVRAAGRLRESSEFENVIVEDRRGRQKQLTYAGSRAMLVYDLPLNEVVFDFYDRLKSVSRGYASFDYHITGYEESHPVKLSISLTRNPLTLCP